MKIPYTILLFFLLILLIHIHAPQAHALPTCPLAQDTKTNQDPVTGLCYSESDPLFNPGLNTTGGTRTCGPVKCPGTSSILSDGNTCVIQANGQCFAGHGTSGFNTPGCTASSTTPLPKCPNPMTLAMRAVDNKGQGISGVTFTITYADAPPGPQVGQTATVLSDLAGTAVIQNQLYSGDHFIIVPSSLYYTFTPTQIGSNTVGAMEMNTNFSTSCGTSLENGTSLPPCAFIATPNGTPIPPSPPPGSHTPIDLSDTTVNDTTNSLMQTMFVLGGIGLIAYLVMAIGGSGKL